MMNKRTLLPLSTALLLSLLAGGAYVVYRPVDPVALAIPASAASEGDEAEGSEHAGLMAAAARGDVEAMLSLGALYCLGMEVAQDEQKGQEWYRKAVALLTPRAESGELEASSLLADCYLKGKGVETDSLRAQQLYLRAAQQGHVPAMLGLAEAYYTTGDSRETEVDAFRWALKAAELSEDPSWTDFWHYTFRRGDEYELMAGTRSWNINREHECVNELRRGMQGFLAAQQVGGAAEALPDDMWELHRLCRQQAEAGNTEALMWLGLFNQVGWHVESDVWLQSDTKEAARLFKLAAERGSVESMFCLGVLNGECGGDDDWVDAEQSAHWYRCAAEKGHRGAALRLAERCLKGLGVPQDADAAADWCYRALSSGAAPERKLPSGMWYHDGTPDAEELMALILDSGKLSAEAMRRLAEAGVPGARNGLGKLYESGRGVEKNEALAAHWYGLAAEQGHAEAMARLAMCLEDGRGVPQDAVRAAQLYARAAEQERAERYDGVCLALPRLAACYEAGRGVERDLMAAADAYVAAATFRMEGVRESLRRLLASAEFPADQAEPERYGAWCYAAAGEEYGIKSLHWVRLAAEAGHQGGLLSMVFMCLEGGCMEEGQQEADPAKAVHWLRQLMDRHQSPYACTELGNLLRQGKGVPQDAAQAVALYRRAAESGREEAMLLLGQCYAAGEGVAQDDAQAFHWFREAVCHHYRAAIPYLVECYERGKGCKAHPKLAEQFRYMPRP